MSYSSRYSSGGDRRYSSSSSSRRDSGRDSPPRHRRDRRSPSPGPSRGRSSPKPRDPKLLPESFGRVQESGKAIDDDLNILQRMKTAYKGSPLEDLYTCVIKETKVKIWTRNYKEVRGVMTGYIKAFDKHWNLILSDVDEVYLQPKKSKTPFLRDIAPNENLPDIPAKVPKQKKEGSAQPPPPAPEPKKDEGTEKKKKRRKKAKTRSAKRTADMLFIRGDNIVMICPVDETPVVVEEGEEGEDNRNSG